MKPSNQFPNNTKQPLVSVVILNFNGKKHVRPCLDSVLDTKYQDFEVIFVDNASTDGSFETVRKNFASHPRVKIIRNNRNMGITGYNVGASLSKGKYIALLNVDIEVDPSWLEELVNVMESDPTIGAAQSKLLNLYDRSRFDCAGGFMDYYGFGCMRGTEEIDEGQYDCDSIFWGIGAALMIRRETANKVGLYDPAFFFSADDVDLCWRIRLSGHKIVYVPTSVVFHGHEHTWKAPIPITFHFYKNTITILLKNYELSNVVKYLPVSIFIAFCVSIFPLLRRDFKDACNRLATCLKATIWNVLNFRQTWVKHLRVQHLVRRVPDEKMLKMMIKKPTVFYYDLFHKPLTVGSKK